MAADRNSAADPGAVRADGSSGDPGLPHHLPCLVLRAQQPAWLLPPATLSLTLFAWGLTLQPTAAGKIDAAHGAAEICMALVWLPLVVGMPFSPRDLLGAMALLSRMARWMGGSSRP